ncbi:PREDICTED: uncharacterized protein LOC105960729 [Erythranthe guttata]|uniref:uncharacterized protein LOC105960729 n=1 Tax=Erythranthe guttata TaxID=4155 RepID=UPI00064DC562|nr:PREDICTED: uncharacterized protein LOC105960729 [Erythranthe guttata]|eukprot:XP_012840391.1 PREDICTED: uncharacterized protein LOC105960729 [Erythranthe guttata]
MGNTLSNNQIALHMFFGENYNEYWSIKMKTFFKSPNLRDIVDEGFTTPPSDTSKFSQVKKHKLAKDMEKDNFTLYNIRMAMADPIFPRISDATSAKEVWDTLKEEFQGNAKVRTTKLQTLRRELKNMKMKDSETVNEYYSRVRELVNQLRANGQDISDKRKKIQDIRKENLEKVLEAEILELKKIEEIIMKIRNSVTRHVGSTRKLVILKKTHEIREQFFIIAFSHHRLVAAREYDPGGGNGRIRFFLLLGFTSYIDSGCSNHMTSNEKIFQDIDNSMKTKVKLCNGALVEAEGLGTIVVNTMKGTRLIQYVLRVPKLDTNLISLAQIMEK